MKTILTILILACASCVPEVGAQQDTATHMTVDGVIRYYGCEYVVFEQAYGSSRGYLSAVVHKGNCANPQHKIK